MLLCFFFRFLQKMYFNFFSKLDILKVIFIKEIVQQKKIILILFKL